MTLFLGILLFSFIINSLAIVPFINFLYRIRLIYHPKYSGLTRDNTTHSHLLHRLHAWKAGTPIGAGLLLLTTTSLLCAAIYPAITRAGIAITSLFPKHEELNVVFFTFLSFGLLGLFDDLAKIFPHTGIPQISLRVKTFLQMCLAVISALLLYKNLGLSGINLPFMGSLSLGWAYVPASALVIYIFSAGYDFTDGLDGLAAGILLIGLFAFWSISASHLDTILSVFISLWIGGLLAFLYFNIYPARLWLGNSGSLAFGATFAVIGLLLGKTTALLVIGFIFIAEIGSSILQYLSLKLLKFRLFPITPLHHWLQVIGWPEPKIVLRAWIITIMFSVFGLWLAQI
ncbi:hypothetical protein A2634_03840 [Candidatus Amesbacteria bacterium RIFCSPHIGHO2_01_FULL_48_32]|uniref:Phospho-N-acetylmuramoyl-pentapeptide-transferase n=1 Tax=Candidatus Amesbacteria bacterium RIFCSPLOWO2_01_FULL_48_25 TaxID=1797259 RepID=A0A1F4ZB84_9BACT|nr:MAG: hypothetical protein A2634_03840 [Candidatus Amesbacteria bacterium RIFCSPHIGHO2_01_FULL_48_32]OGD03488.1 MAG: hypothetical protein A2989_02570 [Candidatus Amesbacteria bacterium RIFCSPLOWO2_01_FULL_48_25]HJZ05795.1 hypothetical protein [Patescibacteria group bacterium]